MTNMNILDALGMEARNYLRNHQRVKAIDITCESCADGIKTVVRITEIHGAEYEVVRRGEAPF